MLQFPVQLLPLERRRKDILHSNDAQPARAPLNNKLGLRSPALHPSPLSVSTNFPHSSSPPPRSPYVPTRNPHSPVSQASSTHWQSISPAGGSRGSSVTSSTLENVLVPGDIVGEGCLLQGEIIRLVSIAAFDVEEPADEFEVVRQLGTGSYAVVYHVREVLSRPPPSEDGHMSIIGPMELNGELSRSASVEYGREYAIKCLSKENLDEVDLQMSEVTIHQSLRSHPNIVTLHRTFETASFLLLLLEYVPGEDLFYFLEQSRDHYEPETLSSDSSLSSSHTPPTPSLLCTLHPSQLLSRTRLRLISSMFSQMCEAVAACHDQQVYHRDIKPENFIVTDGWTTMSDGRRERRVVVKLSDFGLSTQDVESSDMDCGSAPYMSYECRNNIAPTYRPRGADVWSLGIVLINMLYHNNPWTDTKNGSCPSFDIFRQQPVKFFMSRYAGMTRPVAELLAHDVFCILDGSEDDSARMQVRDLGNWAKNLPALLGDHSRPGHKRVISAGSIQGHPIASSTPISHRPCSRPPSACGTPVLRTPAMQIRSLSRAPSHMPTYEMEASELSTVIDQEVEEQEEREVKEDQDVDVDADTDGTDSRSQSNHKRRKRGARKRKDTSVPPQDKALALADASQSLAREISKNSRTASRTTSRTSGKGRRDEPFEPVSMFPVPMVLTSSKSRVPPPKPAPSGPKPSTPSSLPVPPVPTIAKKPSKWKLSFGRNTSVPPVVDDPPSTLPPTSVLPPPPAERDHPAMTVKASNITHILNGLGPGSPPPPQRQPDADDTWVRGRQPNQTLVYMHPGSNGSNGWSAPGQVPTQSSLTDRWSNGNDKRAVSPASGRPVASSSSSTYSNNWRSSMSTTSSAMTSSSAFTKFSNNSVRSVSTAATSVSASSWRAQSKAPSSPPNGPLEIPPPNIKIMNGVPWELDQFPRQPGSTFTGDIFGKPPPARNKQRTRKTKDNKLDIINECTGLPSVAQDASASTISLGDGDGEGEGPKKVQRGQINALAKMLSALRR